MKENKVLEHAKTAFGFVKTACIWLYKKTLGALDWASEKYTAARNKDKV
jgi:hypothetical protein